MAKFKDLTNKKFGRLTVISRNGISIVNGTSGRITWLCKCDCGNEKIAVGIYLTTGRTKSCGCLTCPTEKEFDQRTRDRIKKYTQIDTETGCWNWTGFIYSFGYGLTSHKGKDILAHRASWKVFKGDIPNGMYVLHKCDNRKCVNPDHLFIGTAKDNTQDMIAKGRARSKPNKGINHGCAKLDEKRVNEIKEYKKQGMCNSDIAKIYNINSNTVQKIVNGKIWKHIFVDSDLIINKNPKGFNPKSCKFKIDDLNFIRNAYTNKTHSQKQLAKIFNVNRNTISGIVNGKTYKNYNIT